MCFYYDGYNEFDATTYPKARKEHRCDECGYCIPKGANYVRFTGKFDGELFSFAVCNDCDDLRERIAKIEQSHGCKIFEAYCPYGALMEEAPNYYRIECEYVGEQP